MAQRPEVIHQKHSIDGYPLCWPMDKDGVFDGTHDEDAVTCIDCIHILEEA